MQRLCTLGAVGALVLALGCASSDKNAAKSDVRLPYVVEIVGMSDGAGPLLPVPEEWKDCESLSTLLDPQKLASHLADRLNEKGAFTKVIAGAATQGTTASSVGTNAAFAAPEEPLKADITLHVRFQAQSLSLEEGTPFGDGANRFWPCTMSTGMWLFLGPVCWWIGDREYKVEDVVPPKCECVCQPVWQSNDIVVPVTPRIGYLNYLERHDWRVAWLWNILFPPWAGPVLFGTNLEITNESLAARALEQISADLPGELIDKIDAERVNKGDAYFLIEKNAAGDFLGYVASKEVLDDVRVNDTPQELEAVRGEEFRSVMDRIKKEIAGDMSGLADTATTGTTLQLPYKWAFRVPRPRDAGRFARLQVFGGDARKPVGSWTIAR